MLLADVTHGEEDQALARLAVAIRESRARAGLTQEGLAAQAGMAVRHVQKIEAGEVNVTIRTLAKIAQALGLNISDLFADTDD